MGHCSLALPEDCSLEMGMGRSPPAPELACRQIFCPPATGLLQHGSSSESSYSAPSPSPSYSPPAEPNYNAPETSYSAPAPAPSYNAPPSQSPAPSYNAPEPSYNPPQAPSYAPAKNAFEKSSFKNAINPWTFSLLNHIKS